MSINVNVLQRRVAHVAIRAYQRGGRKCVAAMSALCTTRMLTEICDRNFATYLADKRDSNSRIIHCVLKLCIFNRGV